MRAGRPDARARRNPTGRAARAVVHPSVRRGDQLGASRGRHQAARPGQDLEEGLGGARVRAEADPPRPVFDVSLTPMRRKHVRDVLSIERRVYPRPWSAALFFSEISQRKTRHYIVAMVGKEVAGYGGLMVHEDEGHITTIAVAPELQHAGIGTRLMLDLMAEARNR